MKIHADTWAALLPGSLLMILAAYLCGLPGRLIKSSTFHDKALLTAIRQGDVQTVQSLLDAGANANARDAKGDYAISLAGEAPVVATLQGMRSDGRCVAIEKHRGYEAIVSALLSHGANARVHNQDHWTPLQQAQSFEETNIISLLQHAGINEERP